MNNIFSKKKRKIKKVISMKQFISEFGESFSDHMKDRLMELEMRSVLTRAEDETKLDLKHVEHTRYNCSENLDAGEKEYAYGEFIVDDNNLYFSERCIENENVMQSPIVNVIYSSLNSEPMVFDNDTNGKKIDDSNVDYIVDTILTVFPQVSKEYTDIISKYI